MLLQLRSKPEYYKDFKKIISAEIGEYPLSRKKDKNRYYETPCAFDIETSSWYEGSEKRAAMYIWQFGINGHVFMGRTWRQFIKLLQDVSEVLDLKNEKRLVCYVHNLSYEFQFFRKWITWEKVFSIKSRTPVYAVSALGVEFRCSYILSGYSLANLANQLRYHDVKKMVGDLDYSLIRNAKTKMTEKEIGYCVNDVLVVMAYIQEKIDSDGSIIKIPLTKTGYVRKYCRNACFYPSAEFDKKSFQRWEYSQFMKRLTIEPEEYETLKRAFAGGYTHASAFYSGCTVEDVTSYDFTSSYPYVMVSEQFPMSKGEKIRITSKEEFYRNLKLYACMFDVEFEGIEDTFIYDHYISAYKCYSKENYVSDNGRIVRADRITLTVTEQDFFIIKKTYKWKSMTISNFWRYKRAYLPTNLVKAILKLYSDKTTLKGIEGKEAEYLNSKEMVNACYGMMCTDIVRKVIDYVGDWMPEYMPDLTESLQEYNNSFGRFLFYPWGVWVTAFARRNLWTGILEFADDYLYSDTDSVKAINIADHIAYIENYNKAVSCKLRNACNYHGIDIELTEPKTIKGEKKPLGVWDYDGHYNRFRSLGAKRYLVETDSGINITVAGLNKKSSVPYLCDGWSYDIQSREEHNSPFDRFTDDLYVPAEYTGKSIHTYIDDPIRGRVTDYQGNTAPYYEKTCVHMEGAEYTLSLTQEYIDFILSIQEAYINE